MQPSMRDWLSEGHLAWFILAWFIVDAVGRMDLPHGLEGVLGSLSK